MVTLVLVADPLLGQEAAHSIDCVVVLLAQGLRWPITPVPIGVEVPGHIVCLL